MLKIGWFSTARGDSSRKLLDAAQAAIERGQLQAEIEFVFCSRDSGESEKTDQFIRQVKDYGIPLVNVSIKKFAESYQSKIAVKDEKLPEWRLEYDRQVMLKLQGFQPDICVLAGYMLIVGSEMCSRYTMINLHPALPTGPKGTWQEVIWDLIGQRATESGVMMHLVTPDLDRGPVITYCRYPITGPDFDDLWRQLGSTPVNQIKREKGEEYELFRRIRQAGFIREIPLIIHTLMSFSQGRIKIGGNKQLMNSLGEPISAYDLTQEIDRAVAAG